MSQVSVCSRMPSSSSVARETSFVSRPQKEPLAYGLKGSVGHCFQLHAIRSRPQEDMLHVSRMPNIRLAELTGHTKSRRIRPVSRKPELFVETEPADVADGRAGPGRIVRPQIDDQIVPGVCRR